MPLGWDPSVKAYYKLLEGAQTRSPQGAPPPVVVAALPEENGVELPRAHAAGDAGPAIELLEVGSDCDESPEEAEEAVEDPLPVDVKQQQRKKSGFIGRIFGRLKTKGESAGEGPSHVDCDGDAGEGASGSDDNKENRNGTAVEEIPDWNDLPIVVADKILHRVQLPDIIRSRYVRFLHMSALRELGSWSRVAFAANVYRWEPIHYLHSTICTPLGQREAQAACFHPESGKVFVFGGRTSTTIRNDNPVRQHSVDRGLREDSASQFNDMWAFDMMKQEWERVLVKRSPFPVPKSSCTLVPWGGSLVLYGGTKNTLSYQQQRMYREEELNEAATLPYNEEVNLPREVHVFDIAEAEWRQILVHRIPAGSAGHAALVHGNNMIIIGARNRPFKQANVEFVRYLDLVTATWHSPVILYTNDGVPNEWKEWENGTAVMLRPGLIVFHPRYPDGKVTGLTAPQLQQHQEKLGKAVRVYTLEFNPDNIGDPWTIRAYPVRMEHEWLRRPIPVDSPAAVVRHGDRVKLMRAVVLQLCGSGPSHRPERAAPNPASKMVNRQLLLKHQIEEAFEAVGGVGEKMYDSLSYKPLILCAPPLRFAVTQNASAKRGEYDVAVETIVDSPNRPVVCEAEKNFLVNFIKFALPSDRDQENVTGLKVLHEYEKTRRVLSFRKYAIIEADITDLPSKGFLVWKEVETRGEMPLVANNFLFVGAKGSIVYSGGGIYGDPEGAPLASGTAILQPIGKKAQIDGDL